MVGYNAVMGGMGLRMSRSTVLLLHVHKRLVGYRRCTSLHFIALIMKPVTCRAPRGPQARALARATPQRSAIRTVHTRVNPHCPQQRPQPTRAPPVRRPAPPPRAQRGGPDRAAADAAQRRQDDATILGSALTLTSIVLLAIRFGGPALAGLDAWEGVGGLTAGDFFGAAFWSVALYYASPWQLLLLFRGKIETERPSDWVLRRLGLAARLDVDAIDYVAPPPLQLATFGFFAVSGVVMAAALDAALGDETWAVSGGIGALFAAALYEVGRPERLSVEEAQVLEGQWRDFEVFAEDALLPRGRCHESAVFAAFRARHGKYRTQEALSDTRLRDMVRNWNRGAERSRTGWYRNVSLRAGPESAQGGRPASTVDPAERVTAGPPGEAAGPVPAQL